MPGRFVRLLFLNFWMANLTCRPMIYIYALLAPKRFAETCKNSAVIPLFVGSADPVDAAKEDSLIKQGISGNSGARRTFMATETEQDALRVEALSLCSEHPLSKGGVFLDGHA